MIISYWGFVLDYSNAISSKKSFRKKSTNFSNNNINNNNSVLQLPITQSRKSSINNDSNQDFENKPDPLTKSDYDNSFEQIDENLEKIENENK